MFATTYIPSIVADTAVSDPLPSGFPLLTGIPETVLGGDFFGSFIFRRWVDVLLPRVHVFTWLGM